MNTACTLLAFPLLDRVGRRPLLLWGMSGMMISLAFLGYVFSHSTPTTILQDFSIVAILLFIGCFAFSLGIIMWLMFSEIFPLEVRGIAISVATACNWFFNMVISFSFLPLVDLIGQNFVFFLLSFFCLLGLFFVYFFVPETKQCSLEQIEHNLKKGEKCINLGIKIRR